uniref:DUF4806 domain-containing protein n=1 Tax=Dendroctonus ponderosae TaxID=77166 RepID=A0AAR5QEN3_DENPD
MNEIDTVPPIMKSPAILSLKNDKFPGPDSIQVKILKLMSETDDQFLDILTSPFNDIYNKGEIAKERLESTFIAVPKKQNAKTCDQHRRISLINHITKVFTKIILNRINVKKTSVNPNLDFGKPLGQEKLSLVYKFLSNDVEMSTK